jgi:hypothetical protein
MRRTLMSTSFVNFHITAVVSEAPLPARITINNIAYTGTVVTCDHLKSSSAVQSRLQYSVGSSIRAHMHFSCPKINSTKGFR